MTKKLDWQGSQTFEEHIVDIIRREGVNSPEFLLMVRVFGKLRLREIYRKHFCKKAEVEIMEENEQDQSEAMQGMREDQRCE